MEQKKDWKKSEPSEKQLSFIQSLGSSEVPKTSGEASGIINRLLLIQKLNKIRENVVKQGILKQAELDIITKAGDKWFSENLISYCTIADNCLKVGFDEPPQIGMFFNNFLLDKRKV